jgi:hypothetical protein
MCSKEVLSEVPRSQAGASRKGNYAYIAPLITAYKAGLGMCAVRSRHLFYNWEVIK